MANLIHTLLESATSESFVNIDTTTAANFESPKVESDVKSPIVFIPDSPNFVKFSRFLSAQALSEFFATDISFFALSLKRITHWVKF